MRPRVPIGPTRTNRAAAMVLSALALLASPAANAAAPWSAIEGLQDQADVAVMFDDAADQLASKPGHALTQFVLESGLFDGTLAAWDLLAISLNAEPDALTTRLLSKRVTVLLDLERPPRQDPARAARWAVIADVDPDTDRWIRARLRASPRDALPGATVLAVEDGRFRMATTNRRRTPTRIVLAPANAQPLFERAVAFAANDQPAPARQPLPEGDVVGFANLDKLLNKPATLSWSATLNDSGWDTTLALHGDALNAPAQGLGANTFDALSRGALASITADSPAPVINLILGNAALFPNPQQSPQGPFALSIFRSAPDSAAPMTARLVTRLPDEPAAPARFDALVGAYLVPFVPDATTTLDSFEGRFPNAVRTQDITIRAALLSRWLGTDARVAWRYAEDTYATIACAPAGDDPSPLARHAAQTIETNDDPGQPLALGLLLRPADLAGALSQNPAGPAASLRWLRELRVVLHEPHAPGTSRGRLVLTTTPADAAATR
ncbi:MAG: hypothetical protein RIB32_01875 [Phycisphaerales bacterium]